MGVPTGGSWARACPLRPRHCVRQKQVCERNANNSAAECQLRARERTGRKNAPTSRQNQMPLAVVTAASGVWFCLRCCQLEPVPPARNSLSRKTGSCTLSAVSRWRRFFLRRRRLNRARRKSLRPRAPKRAVQSATLCPEGKKVVHCTAVRAASLPLSSSQCTASEVHEHTDRQ